jgi:phosphoenolpyruvate carboxylase
VRAKPRLSPALRTLVKTVQEVLGDTVRAAEGRRQFEAVERVRKLMVRLRRGDKRALADAAKVLARLSAKEKAGLAKAYTLYMELVNACENAYRTHRLRERGRRGAPAPAGKGANAVFVLTSHPTEARSPQNVELLHRVQDLLVEALEKGRPPRPNTLSHRIRQLWRAGTHPGEKPTVSDEARYIYSQLDDAVLSELLALYRDGHRVRVRAWVGGDKDGHPGVGPEQLRRSFAASRRRLLDFVRATMKAEIASDAKFVQDPAVSTLFQRLARRLEELAVVADGDGGRIAAFKSAVGELAAAYKEKVGVPHPAFERFRQLTDLFPGLVVPLELREERGLFGARRPIAAMLRKVKAVARGGEVGWYARGLIVSMTQSARDLEEAAALVRAVFKESVLPTVPLFEMPADLPRAPEILEEAMRLPSFRRAVRRRGKRLEVMLGYSDTAKRMGSFPSRLAIRDAMERIGRWGRKRGVAIVYFHGAGGSTGRGGGTIQEQAATWPKDALETLKITVQGEMVERLFSTPEILRSQVEKIAVVQSKPPSRRRVSAFARRLADTAREGYESLVADPALYELVSRATPYTRLGSLTIGSRPSKRAGAGPAGLESLRAIPWVLCWTQTRLLLPVWYGLGAAWREESKKPGAKRRLARARSEDPLLRGFLRQLGFSLSKTAPLVWGEYARRLGANKSKALVAAIDRELRAAESLAKAAGGGELLPDREWLEESIRLRAPMIHPLNLLQIELLSSNRKSAAALELFRETVTGVSAGMLTTG